MKPFASPETQGSRVSLPSPDSDPDEAGPREGPTLETVYRAHAQTVARWATDCVVSRLTPDAEPVEAGDTLPDASLAAPPRPTPAARPAKRPFRLHRVRKRDS